MNAIRHYDIKCIPLREEMAELDAAEERDRAQYKTAAILVLYGILFGVGGTLIVMGAAL